MFDYIQRFYIYFQSFNPKYAIQDCATCPLKKQKDQPCAGKAQAPSSRVLKLQTGEEWVTANTIETALNTALQCPGNGLVRFVAGNTSTG